MRVFWSSIFPDLARTVINIQRRLIGLFYFHNETYVVYFQGHVSRYCFRNVPRLTLIKPIELWAKMIFLIAQVRY